MSDEREFNEIKNEELEQVAGGYGLTEGYTGTLFVCPNCGKHSDMKRWHG